MSRRVRARGMDARTLDDLISFAPGRRYCTATDTAGHLAYCGGETNYLDLYFQLLPSGVY